jgi:hypothetical protein
MDEQQNDYDRLARSIEDGLRVLTGNSHEPHSSMGDSMTLRKDDWIRAVIRLQRTADHARGLADGHRRYSANDSVSRERSELAPRTGSASGPTE